MHHSQHFDMIGGHTIDDDVVGMSDYLAGTLYATGSKGIWMAEGG
jgi:hypothetical protein